MDLIIGLILFEYNPLKGFMIFRSDATSSSSGICSYDGE